MSTQNIADMYKTKQIRFYHLVLIILFLNFLSSCGQEHKEIPKQFEKYIKQSKSPIKFKEIKTYYAANRMPVPDFLTKKEALEDIEIFEYLVNTSYSGLEYWSYHGADFKSYFSNLKSFVSQKDTILIGEFEVVWVKFLDLIHDGHMSLIGKERYDAYEHKSIYFSEIIVEKTDDGKFRVINSMFKPVKPGDLFTQKDHEKYVFKTLSPTGKNHYLIGILSFSPISSQLLSFNEKTFEIPFYENRLTLAKYNNAAPFNIERKNNIPLLTVTSFANEIYPMMKEFMESGNQLKNENLIIADVMNNGGGASLFPQTFIENLNGTALWESYWATLKSSSIVEFYANYDLNSLSAQSPNFRNLILYSKEELPKYRNSPCKTWEFSSRSNANIPGTFNGKMIVLTNRKVVSGGEAFVGASQSVRNRIVIGENTGGSGMFSSACGYYLPNSKFIANLPQHFILIPGFEECVGFLPDYWLNTTEPIKEVLAWISSPDSYRFTYTKSFRDLLKGIDMSLVFPRDMNLVSPNSKIPLSIARFSGKWFCNGVLDNMLVVEKINNNNEIDAIYAWGTAPQWNIYKPGWERFKGKIENQKLVLTNGTVALTFQFRPDGSLDGIYERPGVYSNGRYIKIE